IEICNINIDKNVNIVSNVIELSKISVVLCSITFETILTFLSILILLIYIVFYSIISLFGFDIEEVTIEISNINIDKNVNIVSNVIEHKTTEIFDSSIPSNITKVIQEGKDGVTYYNGEETIILEEVIDEEVIIGTGKNGEYTGVMTGYGPD